MSAPFRIAKFWTHYKKKPDGSVVPIDMVAIHPIGQADRGQAVSHDEQRRRPLTAETVEDLRLDRRVDRGGRVVEHQHPTLGTVRMANYAKTCGHR